MALDGSQVYMSNGIRYWGPMNSKSEDDAHDLAIFDFNEACLSQPMLRNRFFPFTEVPPDTSSDRVIALVAAGYPCADQKYDIHETNHLGTFRRVILLQADGQPSDQSILRGRTVVPMTYDSDGLSGGPVFIIQMVGHQPHAYFAGIIQRASGGFMHFLKSGYVKAALDAISEES